jgi:hypothetical protein
MKKYQEPQAHHWIVLRLLRQLLALQKVHALDNVRSTIWLLREVGYNRLMDMIVELEIEEANKC